LSSKELPTLAIKMYVTYPLMAIFLLAACGQATPGTSAPGAAPTTSASASPKPVAATLLETCPKVESVVITTNGMPTAEAWVAAHAKVKTISDAGDLEAQNALIGLLASYANLESDPSGTAFLDARKAYRDALRGLAGRCKTVGSSALQ